MKINKEAKWVRGGFNVVAALMVSAAPVSAVWINELHYDNSGTDAGEFVEIAGVAGTDLNGWSVVLYNGSNGAPYDTDALAGVIPESGNGFGFFVVSYAAGGIQNGAPDGVALVDASGVVIQFLSYEGAFTGTTGPANGRPSTDVGVSELGSIAGGSLHLIGTGSDYADFSWTFESANSASAGAINSGQTFESLAEPDPDPDPDPGPTNGVPDAGASLGLFGFSIAGLCLIARRRRTACACRAAG